MTKSLNECSEAEQMQKLRYNPSSVRFINDPSEAVQICAVSNDPHTLKHIPNPSEQVQLAACSRFPEVAFQHMKNEPTENVIRFALKKDGCCIRYIENPSEEYQIIAVESSSYAIHYIDNPSERVKLASVNKYYSSIEHIKSRSDAVKWAAINKSGLALQYIGSGATNEMIEAALAKNGNGIIYVTKPTIAQQKIALNTTPSCINIIPAAAAEIQIYAANIDIELINKIKSHSNELKMWVALNKPEHFKKFKQTDAKSQIALLQKDIQNIKYIHSIRNEARKYVLENSNDLEVMKQLFKRAPTSRTIVRDITKHKLLINDMAYEDKLALITEAPNSVLYFTDGTPEMYELSFRQDPRMLSHIAPKLSYEAYLRTTKATSISYSVYMDIPAKYMTEELLMNILENDPNMISHFGRKSVTEQMVELVIKRGYSTSSVTYYIGQFPKLCLEFAKKFPQEFWRVAATAEAMEYMLLHEQEHVVVQLKPSNIPFGFVEKHLDSIYSIKLAQFLVDNSMIGMQQFIYLKIKFGDKLREPKFKI